MFVYVDAVVVSLYKGDRPICFFVSLLVQCSLVLVVCCLPVFGIRYSVFYSSIKNPQPSAAAFVGTGE